MCAIFGSFNKGKFKELHALNQYRGELSYSLTLIDSNSSVKNLKQESTKMPPSDVDGLVMQEDDYILGHIQAPTSETSNIHPARNGVSLLWHNGIVKASKTEGWDTQWILDNLKKKSFSFLSEIDGSFACVYHAGYEFYIFRNEISPLFIDHDLNISSTRFEGSEALRPNIVFRVDLQNKRLTKTYEFKTLENPYFFG